MPGQLRAAIGSCGIGRAQVRGGWVVDAEVARRDPGNRIGRAERHRVMRTRRRHAHRSAHHEPGQAEREADASAVTRAQRDGSGSRARCVQGYAGHRRPRSRSRPGSIGPLTTSTGALATAPALVGAQRAGSQPRMRKHHAGDGNAAVRGGEGFLPTWGDAGVGQHPPQPYGRARGEAVAGGQRHATAGHDGVGDQRRDRLRRRRRRSRVGRRSRVSWRGSSGRSPRRWSPPGAPARRRPPPAGAARRRGRPRCRRVARRAGPWS